MRTGFNRRQFSRLTGSAALLASGKAAIRTTLLKSIGLGIMPAVALLA